MAGGAGRGRWSRRHATRRAVAWAVRRTIACVPLALAATPLGAQRVAGRVTEADGRTGIAGAVVALVQDTLATPAVLTAPDGRFVLRAPGAGAWQVRAQAVGRAPQLARPLVLGATDTARVELRFPAFVPTLAAVRAAAPGTCRARPDEEDKEGEVWDAIRTALEASQATERERRTPLELAITDYRLDIFKQRTQASRVTLRSWSGAGFLSTAPDELAARGYVRQVGDSVAYLVPDAAVITSPSFLATHCFRVDERRPLLGARELGLSFRPLPTRTVGDVRGTLWLDPASAALKRLDLEYVVPGRTSSLPNGEATIEYARLPTGRWFVSRWLLQMPVVREVGPAVGGVSSVAFSGWRTREGVARAISLREAARLAPPAVVTGGAWDSTAHAPLVGARVRLAGGGEVRTDSTGTFSLTVADPLAVPSPAALVLDADRARALGVEPPSAEVSLVPGDTLRVTLAIAGTATVRGSLCGGEGRGGPERRDAADGVVVGWLPRFSDFDTANITIVALWRRNTDAIIGTSASSDEAAPARPRTRTATVGPDGRFVLCGLPTGQPVAVGVRAAAGTGAVDPVSVTIAPGTIAEVRLAPPPARQR